MMVSAKRDKWNRRQEAQLASGFYKYSAILSNGQQEQYGRGSVSCGRRHHRQSSILQKVVVTE
jgi:hypothetical protein